MGRTSIPCGEQTRDRLEDLRGDEYKSWDAFLNHLADVAEGGEGAPLEVDGEVVGRVKSMEASVETVEERTGRIERTLEDLR